MKKKNSRRVTTIITIFALMLLLIPAGALFADSIAGMPAGSDETTESVEMTEPGDTEESEPEESEETEEPDGEEGSEQAAYVAERNATAESLGIPSGHLNLIDKLAEAYEITREELPTFWFEADVQDIMKEISRLRFEAKGKDVPPGISKHVPEVTEEPVPGDIAETMKSGKAKGKGKHN